MSLFFIIGNTTTTIIHDRFIICAKAFSNRQLFLVTNFYLYSLNKGIYGSLCMRKYFRVRICTCVRVVLHTCAYIYECVFTYVVFARAYVYTFVSRVDLSHIDKYLYTNAIKCVYKKPNRYE